MDAAFGQLFFCLFFLYGVSAFKPYETPCLLQNGTIAYYDPEKDQCCFGIEKKQEGKRCCVGEKRFYYTEEQICCDRLYDKVTGDKVNYCCGDKKLVSGEDDGLCCQGVYYSNVVGEAKEHYSCCGSEFFDRRIQQCCEHNAQPVKYSVHPYQPNLECCGLNVINTYQEKCGRNGVPLKFEENECFVNKKWEVYNVNERRCCYESLHNVPETNTSVQCCGKQLIFRSQEKCCPTGHAIPNEKQFKCCGQGYIDTTKEKCCNGQAINMTDDQKNYCCGSQLINYREQDCCAGQPYNRETEQCCGVTILSSQDTCCGSSKVEKGDRCCFNSVLVKGAPDDHNACCYTVEGRSKTYNNRTKICRDGRIITKRSNTLLKPCGDGYYHRKDDLCCNEKKYVNGSKNGLMCCGAGYKAYHRDIQICCVSEVYNIPENSGRCCRGMGYKIDDVPRECEPTKCGDARINPEHSICCRGKKFSILEGDSCCGASPFLKKSSTCCGDRRLYNSSNITCCGARGFIGDNKMCCGDLEIIPRRSKKRKCCGNLLPYSPADNFCNENGHVNIYDKRNPPPETVCLFDAEEMRGVRDHWPMYYCSHKMVIFGNVRQHVQIGNSRSIINLNRVHKIDDKQNYSVSVMPRLRLILPDVCKNSVHLIGKTLMFSTDRLPTHTTISLRSAHKFFVTEADKDLRKKVQFYKNCHKLLS